MKLMYSFTFFLLALSISKFASCQDSTQFVIDCSGMANTAFECVDDIPNIESLEEFKAQGGYVQSSPDSIVGFTVSDDRGDSECPETVTITYTISNSKGDSVSCSKSYAVNDQTPPTLILPDKHIHCDETWPYYSNYVDVIQFNGSHGNDAFDNCGSNSIRFVSFVSYNKIEGSPEIEERVYRITDRCGNSSMATEQIFINDTIPPQALCRDIEVYLDENGIVQISTDDVDAGSTDNCGLQSIEISKDMFDCTEVGDNIVQLVATDVYGNTDTCQALVKVHELIPPFITCVGPITVQLDETGKYELTWQMLTDSVSDNCAIDTILLGKDVLDCDDIGTVFIPVTAIDVHGNFTDCVAEIEVFGNIPPIASNDTVITTVNTAIDIDLLANDYDLLSSIDRSTLNIIIQPSNGSVAVDTSTGILTYTPHLNYTGTDVFRYTVCDDAIPCMPECDEALVFISVRPTGDNITSMHPNDMKEKLLVAYPNPNDGNFSLKLENFNPGDYQMQIVNDQGQSRHQAKMQITEQSFEKQFHMDKLSKGIYFIHVFNASQQHVEKIVIR